jgi:hypothetical protein
MFCSTNSLAHIPDLFDILDRNRIPASGQDFDTLVVDIGSTD